MIRFTLLTAILAAIGGCRIASGRPDPAWTADIDRTTRLTLRHHNQTLDITDASAIRRFADIYASSHWEIYWHTLPADIADRPIRLMADETKLRSFGYNGTLWETQAYDDVRTAELRVADRDWIDSLFAQIPNVENASTKGEDGG